MKPVDPPLLLIAEDETELSELIAESVRPLGIQVVQAFDGESALEQIKRAQAAGRPIDAILSDINMPKLDGITLLEKVRQLGLENPFVFLTAHGDKQRVITALKLGAMDFLEKPYDTNALLAIINRAVAMGVSLRTLNAELEEICRSSGLPAQKLGRFREAQKAVLLLKHQSQVLTAENNSEKACRAKTKAS